MSTTTLPETIGRLLGFGAEMGPAEAFVSGVVGAAIVGTGLVAMGAAAGPWAKRKIAAAFWDEVGPNRHGPFGVLISPVPSLVRPPTSTFIDSSTL